MTAEPEKSGEQDRHAETANPKRALITLLLVAVAIPLLTCCSKPLVRSLKSSPQLHSGGTSFPESKRQFEQQSIGPEPAWNAQITNVQTVDFDQDGLLDVIVCDALRSQVIWYRRHPQEDWEEHVLGSDLLVPAHATVEDLDQDGDQDVVVAILGDLFGTDRYSGRVVWLEQTAEGFVSHVILDDVRRVTDVRVGDLDGDDDFDIAVAVFGYSIGQILWLENRGGEAFRDHVLLHAPGTIHVPLADFDGDGDLDIAAVVSQEEEEIWAFENNGGGVFQSRRLHVSDNFDIGSAGLVQDDLDGDGDPDLIWPIGDNLEYEFSYPQPYHGCIWFENKGDWEFEPHRIANFGGAYAAAAGDIDGDGDRDVVLVSMVNDWQKSGNPCIVWLENDGIQQFRQWRIADRPTHLTTVACGDLDGDGRDDIVAGVMKKMLKHTDRDGRVVSWRSGDQP